MISLYLLNKKGFEVLKHIILNESFKSKVSKVILARDKGNNEDFYEEMELLCIKNNIKVFNRNQILNDDSNISLAIGWRWLINNTNKLIVIHDSVLPAYRGFSPLVNMLINGEKEIGASMIFANENMDEGDIIKQVKLKINYPIKIKEAIDLMSNLYVDLVDYLFIKLCSNINLKSYKQNEKLSSYSIWIDEKDYFIDWNNTPQYIKRFVDSVGYPYDGAKICFQNNIITVREVEVLHYENKIEHFGKIIAIKNNQPIVLCREGAIKITGTIYNGQEFIFNKLRVRL